MLAPGAVDLGKAKWALRITFFFMGLSVAASTARLAEIKQNTNSSQSAFGAVLMLGNLGAMFGIADFAISELLTVLRFSSCKRS